MKIEKIDLYQMGLPYAGGVYRLSGSRTFESFDASIVRVTCDDGTEGWGESTPFGSTYIAAHSLGARAGIAELAPALLGRDPRQADRIGDVMDSTLAGHNHAKAPSTSPVGTPSASRWRARSASCSVAPRRFRCR